MRREGGRTVRNGLTAAALIVAGAGTAWLSVRTALVRSLPPTSPLLQQVVPHGSDGVLARATAALVEQKGIMTPDQLAGVRQAAIAAPLDARAFLVLGHQQLLDRQPGRAVRTLEAARRLDPRQRLVHLLLLDRYLRTARYVDAATEFSLLSKLLSGTQAPIAAAMAQMSVTPETRAAVRRTLATDPDLERSVLVALARSTVAPATIWSLATPAARVDAGSGNSWGPALVNRLVQQGRFGTARAVWQHIYRLPADAVATPVFNGQFANAAATPPFNWTLTQGSLGAADLRANSLNIDYYGRDTGELASQLLVLTPGRYVFTSTVDPGKTDGALRLFWTIACATGNKAAVMNLPVAPAARPRRLNGAFAVPASCPAQTLSLRAEAGDLPVPAALTLRDVAIRPLAAVRS